VKVKISSCGGFQTLCFLFTLKFSVQRFCYASCNWKQLISAEIMHDSVVMNTVLQPSQSPLKAGFGDGSPKDKVIMAVVGC
jgi:hypothetical protein